MIRKTLQEELLPSLPHLADGNFIKATFVKGSNGTMRFLRVPNLTVTTNSGSVSAGTAPWLTEGVPPTAQEFTFAYEEFTAYQAGQFVRISDVAAMESPINLKAKAGDLIARQAAATADEYVGRILAAGTDNVVYAGAGNAARLDVGATDVLTGTVIRRMNATLGADSVPKFGHGGYKAIIHNAVVFDFEEDDDVGGWLTVGTYSDPSRIEGSEIGMYAGTKFLVSPSSRIFAAGGAGGVDIYSTFVFGPDAYAFGDWGSYTMHYVAPGGKGDELYQNESIGWKGFLGAKLVTGPGARYGRIESASGL
jgi:N4-gp56 family major capsid protein